MNESSENKQSKATIAYQELMQSLQSLILGTIDEQGNPHTSYAPFVMDTDQNFYLLGSELANHTHHLLKTGKASILLIEDEAKTNQIFGRRRLSFYCTVSEILRSDAAWNTIIEQLENRFGEIATMIASLPDFHLFKLIPQGGRFVMGFGSTYEIDSDNLDQLIPFKKG